MPPAQIPCSDIVKVPINYWEDLERRDVASLCDKALARNYPPKGLLLPSLGDNILVNKQKRCICRLSGGHWKHVDHPLLELFCLVYLLNVGPEPLTQDLVSVQELKCFHFFRGSHELKVRPLLERYGNDLDGFKKAAERLGSEELDLADAAYKVLAFPKVPLYYLLWMGDQEFKSRLSILFDRSIEHHLSADAIWGLVNLVSDALLIGDYWALSPTI